MLTTTICVCYLNQNKAKTSCRARNWITRRQQRSNSNLIREVQCEDEAEFRGIFRKFRVYTGRTKKALHAIAYFFSYAQCLQPVRTGSVCRPLVKTVPISKVPTSRMRVILHPSLFSPSTFSHPLPPLQFPLLPSPLPNSP